MRFEQQRAHGTYQSGLIVMLSPSKSQLDLVYLVDIFTFISLSSPEEHTVHVKILFYLLKQEVGSLNLKKFSSFTDSIDYFGHFIQPDLLSRASHTTDRTNSLKPLTNITEMKSFLDL